VTTVLIGVGNVHRRDDGIGPAVVGQVAATNPHGVRIVTCAAEPTAILDAWDGCLLAVLVDAAVGVPAGSVRQWSLAELDATSTPVSSHDLSLRQTFELARALGRAPGRVVVIGVGVADSGHGAGLSPEVRSALPEAVRLVGVLLGEQRQEASNQQA
jgi:hydrogenase maturation protease